MKNFPKYFLFFLLSVIPLLIISETYFYQKSKNSFEKIFKVQNEIHGKNTFNISYFSFPKSFDVTIKNFTIQHYPVNEKYNGKSIIVFGCSYPASNEIKENKNKFCYKLSDEIKRPVYNRTFSGGGTQQMYYFLTNEEFIRDIKEPEYIIYFFINDHIERFYKHQFWNPFETNENLRYKIKNGKVERIYPHFFNFWFLYTVKQIQRKIEWTNMDKQPQEALFLNFVDFMKAVKKVSSEKYPNAKFVILLYNDKFILHNKDFINNSDWNLLRKEGFYIYDTKDLTDKDLSNKKYKSADLFHPNEKAWEEVIPPLVKELKKI